MTQQRPLPYAIQGAESAMPDAPGDGGVQVSLTCLLKTQTPKFLVFYV